VIIFVRWFSIVGPRTVEHRKNYTFVLHSYGYNEDVQIVITLNGNGNGTESNDIFNSTYLLGHQEKEIKIDVS
jgi:hypothetical protein